MEGCTTEHYRRSEEEYTRTTYFPQAHQPPFRNVNGIIAADVIQRHLLKFVQMDPTILATNLFTKKLLSKPSFRKILDSQAPEKDLTRGLLESLEIIKVDGGKFNDLLLILADDSVNKQLMVSLMTEYGECSTLLQSYVASPPTLNEKEGSSLLL